ncbi:MAG: type II secretion system inner membrane protein GspF [Gammaproteobacteria bacterium]|nr:type II secretion system inner membrane protein GspF [Gammaproteobacteria bacterium]
MAAFEYTAIDARGRQKKGIEEGDSSRQVRQALRDRGLAPTSVVHSAAVRNGEAKGSASSYRLGLRRTLAPLELALFTRQLATLVAAGLPVEESLATIARQSDKRRVSALVMNVRAQVLEGHSLAAALGEYPSAFAAMYRSTVAAGEQSGYLHAVLNNLADHTEQRFESVRNVQMALFYPVLLFVVSIGIISGLMVYVVPKIVGVFERTGNELPFLTSALIEISGFLRANWWIIAIAVGVLVLVVRWLLRQAEFRLAWDHRKLRLPIVGKVVRSGNASRYASTLAILTSSGVPLVDAMHIATEVVTNSWLKRRLAEAVQKVSEGSSLRAALEAVQYFPPMLLHMVASGEASGQLDSMLAKVADYQQKELTRMVTTMVQLFQPLMLLVMAGLVLMIVLAILVPILSMNQLVS